MIGFLLGDVDLGAVEGEPLLGNLEGKFVGPTEGDAFGAKVDLVDGV